MQQPKEELSAKITSSPGLFSTFFLYLEVDATSLLLTHNNRSFANAPLYAVLLIR